MKKVFIVKTDDPERRRFNLVFSGSVKRIMQITPRALTIEGLSGQTLTGEITITPVADYQFSIKEVRQLDGSLIKVELVKPAKKEKSWKLKVKVSSNKVEQLYDKLTVLTDSPFKPKLTIRIYATFFDKTKPLPAP